jgi:two-component system, NarL family, sensor histidine kinase DesK
MSNPLPGLHALRMRLLPERFIEEEGYAPLWSLLYLGFLFMNWNDRPLASWLPATLLSIVLFLPLYFRAMWLRGRRILVCAAAIAALGFALAPFNTSSNTYLIYAGAILPISGIPLRASIAAIFAGLALFAAELALLLHWPLRFVIVSVAISALVATAICIANHSQAEKRQRQAELKLSHDEVRRLAALAERERIGRDLHDLLGHTLSLITLKSELAARLFDRDPLAARREIVDVERVARDALGQVRRAVTGIRTAGIAAELASARLLLELDGIRLHYSGAETTLPPQLETVLALVVREAVTNVQRHAGARSVRIELESGMHEVLLLVADDGIGAPVVPGNGLAGMRERLAALDGRLTIEAVRGAGTRLVVRVPLARLPCTAPARTVPDA